MGEKVSRLPTKETPTKAGQWSWSESGEMLVLTKSDSSSMMTFAKKLISELIRNETASGVQRSDKCKYNLFSKMEG
jgi:hypothetical protein